MAADGCRSSKALANLRRDCPRISLQIEPQPAPLAQVDNVLNRMASRCQSRGQRLRGNLPDKATWVEISELLRPAGRRRSTEETTSCDDVHDKGSVKASAERAQDKAYGIMLETRDKISTLEGHTSATSSTEMNLVNKTAEVLIGSSSGFRSTYLQIAKAHQELLHALHGSGPRSRPAGVQTVSEESDDGQVEEDGELLDLLDEREIVRNSHEREAPSSKHTNHCGGVQEAEFSGAVSHVTRELVECYSSPKDSAEMSVLTDTTDQRAIEGFVSEAAVAELLTQAMTITDCHEEGREELLVERRVELGGKKLQVSGLTESKPTIAEDAVVVNGEVVRRAESFLEAAEQVHEEEESSGVVEEPATVPSDQGNMADQPIGCLERVECCELMKRRATEAHSTAADLRQSCNEEDILSGSYVGDGEKESAKTSGSKSNCCRGRTREDLCGSNELVMIVGKKCVSGDEGNKELKYRDDALTRATGSDELPCTSVAKTILAECYGQASTSDTMREIDERKASDANWTGMVEYKLQYSDGKLTQGDMGKEFNERRVGEVARRNAMACRDGEKEERLENFEGTNGKERQLVRANDAINSEHSGEADDSRVMEGAGELHTVEGELLTLEKVEEQLPNIEGDLSTVKGKLLIVGEEPPATDEKLPAGEGELPTGEGEIPTGGGDLPKGEGEIPTGGGDLPTGEGDLPKGEGDLPTGEGDLPKGEGDLPKGEGDLPKGGEDLPTGEGDLPKGEEDLPTGEGDLQTGEEDLPTGEGDLPTLEKELPKSNSDDEPTSQGSSEGLSHARKARLVTPELAIFDTFARLVRQAKAYRKPRRESDDGSSAEDEKGWSDVRGGLNNYLPDMTPKEQKTVRVAVSKKRLMNAEGGRRKLFDADPF